MHVANYNDSIHQSTEMHGLFASPSNYFIHSTLNKNPDTWRAWI